MSKLEKLYSSIETLKGLGLKLDTKLLEETSRLEEEIIKNDVIPLLEEQISPLISQIKRELVLVIDYLPDEPITVRITRKRSISSINSIEEVPRQLPETKTFVSRQSFTMAPHSKSNKTVLSVKFPDGKVISERFAYQTLINTIEKVGYEKVGTLGITCAGVPLVSNKKDDFYRQEEVRKGLFIMTHSATSVKKQQLDEISQRLKLGLKVDIV